MKQRSYMIKNVVRVILPSLIFAALTLTVAVAPLVGAADTPIEAGAESAKGQGQSTDLFGQTGVFQTITNVLLFILGAISVIMIIIGGIRYVLSGGNSTAVTAAKNTILYAIVGVIVALLAYAIVNFVLTSFSSPGTGGTNV